jgi:hypothetical protein
MKKVVKLKSKQSGEPGTKSAKGNKDNFYKYAGMWEKRNISLTALRDKAWNRKNLKNLVSKITMGNRYDEIYFGLSVGKEVF